VEHWISKLDPNVIVPLVIGALGWLWHHRKNLSLAKLREAADAAITTEVHLMLDDHANRQQATDLLATAAWKALGKLGVKDRPKWAAAIVGLAVEEGLAELAEKLHERDLAKIAAGVQRVKDAFVPPVRPGVPRLDLDIEKVEP